MIWKQLFFDIDLQPHKDWEDKVCAACITKSNFTFVATRPIVLVNQMLENGIVTMIVSCNTMMGEQYLGKILTKELAQELHEKGIDPW
jgi:diphthamide synthase (EF-2-diphthine--ammonia ligase)